MLAEAKERKLSEAELQADFLAKINAAVADANRLGPRLISFIEKQQVSFIGALLAVAEVQNYFAEQAAKVGVDVEDLMGKIGVLLEREDPPAEVDDGRGGDV